LRRLVSTPLLLSALPVPGSGHLKALACRAARRLLGQRVAHVVAAARVDLVAVPHVILKTLDNIFGANVV